LLDDRLPQGVSYILWSLLKFQLHIVVERDFSYWSRTFNGDNGVSTRQIHIFISHAWAYSDHYKTLSEWIFQPWRVGQASLDFRDFSIPKHDSILKAANDNALQIAIFAQIARSHVVVIPTGMYAHHSKWIRKEIDGAEKHSKPILAVDLWGSQRTCSVVATAADKVIGWNKQPLVNAIWQLYYYSQPDLARYA
jgi:hypothetical protein